MARTRKLPEFIEGPRDWWERNCSFRSTCFGETRQYSHEIWTNKILSKWVLSINAEGKQNTSTRTPRLRRSKTRMSATTIQVYGWNKAVLQTKSSEQTKASKSESTIRRKWWLWLRCWSENRMEMVQRAAGRLAAYFVFVVFIMAEFLMTKVWRRVVSDIFFKADSFRLPERGTDNSTGSVHTHSVHHEHYSLLTSTNMKCVLVAQDVTNCSVIFGALKESVIWSVISSPWWSLPHFQSTTTRSTTWTARSSPRRHSTSRTSSTRLSDNDRSVELLLRTIKSVNQLSVFEFIAHWSKNFDDEDSSEAPTSDDSDSSGTLYAIQVCKKRRLPKSVFSVSRECQRLQDEFMAETKQLCTPIHPSKQRRQNSNQQFEGSEDYDYVVDRKTGWKWYKEQHWDLAQTSSLSSSSWQNSSWQKSDEEQWVTFFTKHAVSDCRNVVRTTRRGVYTEYTLTACITNTTVFSQARTDTECVLVARVWLVPSLRA